MYANFKQNMARLRNYLLSKEGYRKIWDTYHPLEYRLGTFAGPLEPEVLSNNRAGSFDLVFNCKPQRFLNSGDAVITLTESGTITNEGGFPSRPLIRVYGTGTVGIGNNAITITEEIGGYTDIDCEMMDAYNGATNRNRYVRIQNNDFPAIPVGNAQITLDGVSEVEITPRWWII
jgi:phage-related protein